MGEEEVQVQSDDLTLQGEVEVEVNEADEEKHSVIVKDKNAKNIVIGEVVSDIEENRAESKCPDIEVVKSEEEFNRRKADNSAPVVIFEDVDEDWQQQEEGISFGFDVNQDLVLHAGGPESAGL